MRRTLLINTQLFNTCKTLSLESRARQLVFWHTFSCTAVVRAVSAPSYHLASPLTASGVAQQRSAAYCSRAHKPYWDGRAYNRRGYLRSKTEQNFSRAKRSICRRSAGWRPLWGIFVAGELEIRAYLSRLHQLVAVDHTVVSDRERSGSHCWPLTQGSRYKYTVDTPLLTSSQRDFYEQNGFLVVRGLVSRDRLEEYKTRFQQLCSGEVKVWDHTQTHMMLPRHI